MTQVTHILSQIEEGDPSASEKLLPLVYGELRKLAAAKLSKEKNPGLTLQPTVLVHEAYLRLVDNDEPQQWNGRGHFFAAAAEAMRRILVENARRKQAAKHGGQMRRVNLDVNAMPEQPSENLLALDEALKKMEEQFPDKAKLVKLRYFAGLTIPQASEAMKISTATAERHWRFARAWLHSQLKTGP